MRAALLLACALSLPVAGCAFSPIHRQCPSCVVLSRFADPPPLPQATRTLFVLIPGLLGMGWEWDVPLSRLGAVEGAFVETFEWRNSSSARRIAKDLAERINARLGGPGPLERIVIIGHSAAGLFTSLAAAELRVPAGRSVFIANVGSPYAGMHTTPLEYPDDDWGAPITFAMGGILRSYPRPAARVTIESWVTPWPGDPVMEPRWGHQPGDPRVGPPGIRHNAPPGTDHNRYLSQVVEEIAQRETTRLQNAIVGQRTVSDR